MEQRAYWSIVERGFHGRARHRKVGRDGESFRLLSEAVLGVGQRLLENRADVANKLIDGGVRRQYLAMHQNLLLVDGPLVATCRAVPLCRCRLLKRGAADNAAWRLLSIRLCSSVASARDAQLLGDAVNGLVVPIRGTDPG